MAKSRPSVDPLVAGLMLAASSLPKLLPIIGTKGKALFAKTNEPIAKRAVDEGLLTKMDVVIPARGRGRASTVTYGMLTESGARKLASASDEANLATLLESLLSPLQIFSSRVANPTPPDSDAKNVTQEISGTITKAMADVRHLLEALPGKVAEVIAKSMSPANTSPISTNPGPLISLIQDTLQKIKAEPRVIHVPILGHTPPPSPSPPISKPGTINSIADEILAFVQDWTRRNSVGPQFDAIIKHLRVRHPDLTIGCFHDALRVLADANPPLLRLTSWHKTVHELPEPELALFIKHTINYYANTTQ